MTFPASSAVPYPPVPHRSTLRLTEPGDLIAALPAMIGFYPEDSVVGVCLGGAYGTEMRGFIRGDIPYTDQNQQQPSTYSHHRQATRELGRSFARFCVNNEVDELVLIAIDSRNDPRDREALLVAIGETTKARGITITGAFHCTTIADGESWERIFPVHDSGTISDPGSSEAAALTVVAGRTIYDKRSDIEQSFESRDSKRKRRIADAMRQGSSASSDSSRLISVLTAVGHIGASQDHANGEPTQSRELDDAEVITVAQAIEHKSVRDCLFALSLTEHASAADAVWTTLTQLVDGAPRVEAATLAAFSAYIRGDGPRAGVALDIALEIDPDHRMSTMLDQALRAGMPPHQVAGIAAIGWELAENLGVTLPPATEMHHAALEGP
ncbi:DUF4192 domain-containing protein [Hoyosella rhizosphaerae]|nr:DUF4192 domain-containing protein [Hoyosella rhizosphaerae]MBN4926367.1 DUF4192 domain-containing protein [Hoyosella rhizosphaerae]